MGGDEKMGVFVAGVPSSLAPRTPFFSRVLAPFPFPRLRLLRRLEERLRRRLIFSVSSAFLFLVGLQPEWVACGVFCRPHVYYII